MDYQTYHESLSSVIDEIKDVCIKYEIITDIDKTWFGAVSYETTSKYDWEIDTLKGKPTKKYLHASIYRLNSGNYELTLYVL